MECITTQNDIKLMRDQTNSTKQTISPRLQTVTDSSYNICLKTSNIMNNYVLRYIMEARKYQFFIYFLCLNAYDSSRPIIFLREQFVYDIYTQCSRRNIEICKISM